MKKLLSLAFALACGCSSAHQPGDVHSAVDRTDAAVTVPDLGNPPRNGDLGEPADGATMMGAVHVVSVGPASANLSFVPSDLTIAVGDTVRWEWAPAKHGHNVVSGANGMADNQFCSPSDSDCANAPTSLAPAVYQHTFTRAGVYPYFCTPHFDYGMTGTVTVK